MWHQEGINNKIQEIAQILIFLIIFKILSIVHLYFLKVKAIKVSK